MCFSRERFPQISIEKCVLDSTDKVCQGLEGLIPSTKLIVESLVWCFVARRSLREVLFEDIEYGRFITSMRATALRIVSYQTVDTREQSYVKYWIDSYLAAGFLDSERPVRESWNLSDLFSGWCKRFVSRAVARRDLSFLYSLQKGSKQMWGPLSDENVRKTIRKSKERLCSVRGMVPDVVARTIRRVAGRIFRRPDEPVVSGLRFMPSGSAVLQASLKDGGALSLFEPMVADQTGIVLPGGKSVGMLHSLTRTIDEWRQSTFDSAVDMAYAHAMDMDEDGGFTEFDVRFVHIFEPGKIRNISISDGYVATALQPLQGDMLSAWKRTPWSTMLHDDLLSKVRDMDAKVDEPLWCSGDYEAATDLLFKDATIACFSALTWHPLFPLGNLSLISGSMIYPDEETLKFEKNGVFVGTRMRMYEGQLMGHTLSFPMLCVINLSVLRHALDEWVDLAETNDDEVDRARRAEVIFENALVNGDDILFKGTSELIEIFKYVASSVGFKTSQGKNYISPDTCVINSQVYLRREGKMRRQGYLNLRLIKGNNIKARVAANEAMVTPDQIGKELSKMAFNCPWTASAIPAAFSRWKDDWKVTKYQPNWYLPVHLGGYGVDIALAPASWQVTRGQRLMAARFVADPRLALYRMKGMTVSSAKLAFALLRPVMVGGDYVPQEFEIPVTEASDDWLARMAYASRAINGASRTTDEVGVVVSRFAHDFRLSPMSAEGLVRYWRAQLFVTGAPACPPIGEVKFKNVPKGVFRF
jgi:hypothetical protein